MAIKLSRIPESILRQKPRNVFLAVSSFLIVCPHFAYTYRIISAFYLRTISVIPQTISEKWAAQQLILVMHHFILGGPRALRYKNRMQFFHVQVPDAL